MSGHWRNEVFPTISENKKILILIFHAKYVLPLWALAKNILLNSDSLFYFSCGVNLLQDSILFGNIAIKRVIIYLTVFLIDFCYALYFNQISFSGFSVFFFNVSHYLLIIRTVMENYSMLIYCIRTAFLKFSLYNVLTDPRNKSLALIWNQKESPPINCNISLDVCATWDCRFVIFSFNNYPAF